MTDPDVKFNEADQQDKPEEQIEPVNEITTQEEVKEDTKGAELPPPVKPVKRPTKEKPIRNPDDPVTSKTALLEEKYVTCPKCFKRMLLRSFRYKHEKICQGELQNRPIKPQAKPKAKVKAVAVRPLTNSSPLNDITNIEERIQQYQHQQPVQAPPEPKPFSIQDYYKQLRQDAVNRKKAEVDNLTKNIFKGCRAKKRF